MNDEFPVGAKGQESLDGPRDLQTLGSSTIYRLCEEVIGLRETNNRTHKFFEQELAKVRTELGTRFNLFVAETQKAYQKLREEIQGEKKFSMALLMALLELFMELEHLMNVRPAPEDHEGTQRWAEGVGVQARKVQATIKQHGIISYDAVIGQPYNPALHERVGSAKFEGMGPLLVGAQKEPGYASQLPDFKLVRAKVIVSE
jgi:molecular chaperone GrpE (heat shock protein)